ncbi:hypothetical protein U9M48_010862 [Paspalum notatum var. saurae]|uniref:Uncharacterized protein n=1 Tax=Paspalum notatum var. saurae TaxID=547442 RepID=A0AAQ3STY2_PASNO
MAGVAATLLRSAARSSKTPILVGARSLPRQQSLPQTASAVLSPRFLSSTSPGSPNQEEKNYDLLASSKQVTGGLKMQIEEAKKELLHLLMQMQMDTEDACAKQQGAITSTNSPRENDKGLESSHSKQVPKELKKKVEEKKERIASSPPASGGQGWAAVSFAWRIPS